MSFHGKLHYTLQGAPTEYKVHENFIASSSHMLDFNGGVLEAPYSDGLYRPVTVSQGYTRVIQHQGQYYGIARG
eukprot:3134116-Ditylum_brightwellii.AAC.1